MIYRVQRGGSCDDGTVFLYTTDYCWCGSVSRFWDVGFRVVIRRKR